MREIDPKFYAVEIQSPKLTIVDFTASWCQPCKVLTPVLEAVEMEMPNVRFLKIDVDNAKELTLRLGVKSVPTLFAYRNGEEVGRVTGVTRHDKIVEWISGFDT
jgi:thioredoxin